MAETGHGGSLITMALATVRVWRTQHATAPTLTMPRPLAVQMHRSTSMWSLIAVDGARRSRFAALFGKLAPLYLFSHAGP